jgi:hypothetical protein
MKLRVLGCVGAICLGLLTGCVTAEEKRQLSKPVNCNTAEGDLRVLQSEKNYLAERVIAGASAVMPAGAVLGILTGTEDDKLEIAVGEYDRRIDRKMAEIRRTCGL